ncbi:MAG: LysM peptidoglycan-binding domain-containing protein [Candidatus Schekmanbacteria bacterium]|nr:LysM peptidoglycan-binding domain-containing protein [Candidatus Schekmanbacteria bacterium]
METIDGVSGRGAWEPGKLLACQCPVAPGETLQDVADRCRVPVELLRSANRNFDPRAPLPAGASIVLPFGAGHAIVPPAFQTSQSEYQDLSSRLDRALSFYSQVLGVGGSARAVDVPPRSDTGMAPTETAPHPTAPGDGKAAALPEIPKWLPQNLTGQKSVSKSAQSDERVLTHRVGGTTARPPKEGAAKPAKTTYGPGDYGQKTYGFGNEIVGGGAYVGAFGQAHAGAEGSWGAAEAGGETRYLEARGRAYNYAQLDPIEGLTVGYGAQGQLNLIRASYGAKYQSPKLRLAGQDIADFSADSHVDAFVGAQGDANAAVILGPNPGIRIGAAAFAGARVDADAMVQARTLGIRTRARGTANARAGAEAGAKAELRATGAKAEAGAFAGAAADAGGQVDVAGVGAKGTASAWAGVGAKAKGELGYVDGKLQFGFELGAALGIGGSVGWGVSIDVKRLVEDAQAFGGTMAGLGEAALDELEKAGTEVADFFERSGTAAEELVAGVGDDVRDALSSVSQSVATAAEDTADALGSAAEEAGNAVADAAESAGDAIADAFSGW